MILSLLLEYDMNYEIINYLDNVKYNDIDLKYKEFDLVFSGGGLKGFYHIGICKILKYHEFNKNIKIRYIIGTSTGALSAVMYACNIDLNIWYNSYYVIKDNINKMDMVSIIVKILKEHLPNDAYKRCSNRVKISLSNLTFLGFHEELIDNFDSNEHLISVLSAAIRIPYVTSNIFLPENIKNKFYYDGFFVRIIPIIYNNDLPQLLINTHLTNYSNNLSLSPQDSFIELLSLRGMYESNKFFRKNINNKTIKWIEKYYKKPKNIFNKYLYIVLPSLFFIISIKNWSY